MKNSDTPEVDQDLINLIRQTSVCLAIGRTTDENVQKITSYLVGRLYYTEGEFKDALDKEDLGLTKFNNDRWKNILKDASKAV